MRVHSIRLTNFGPFRSLEEFRFGQLSTIIGRNDTGKSHIIRALQIFLNDEYITKEDIYNGARHLLGQVIIEVAFDSLPKSIELEKNIASTLEDENLLDSNGHLRIRRTFSYDEHAPISEEKLLVVNDFSYDDFAGLFLLDRDELDLRCKKLNVIIRARGPGATNKSKRAALRAKARENHSPIEERYLPLSRSLRRSLQDLLPNFELFGSNKELGTGKDDFHDYLLPILDLVSNDSNIQEKETAFIEALYGSFNKEMSKVIKILRRYTDTFINISIMPKLNLRETIGFDIYRKDENDIETSIDNIGSGSRRLLMLALFQYLAERDNKEKGKYIFAIEEPENCLHPGLQRELAKAFSQMADKDHQIIITSHSPVFVGNSPIKDLALVTKTNGIATCIQYPSIDLDEVANQLGIEPADQIAGYRACIFVEGINDIVFWKTVASKLKNCSRLEATFEDKRIGFILSGGDNLKHWIDIKAMQRLNRHFAVIIDSDLKSSRDTIDNKKLIWKGKCEHDGGKFIILRKRTIENYLHPNAIRRSGRILKPFHDYTAMKKEFDRNVYEAIDKMTCKEILSKDRYVENGIVRHELKDIIENLLALPDI